MRRQQAERQRRRGELQSGCDDDGFTEEEIEEELEIEDIELDEDTEIEIIEDMEEEVEEVEDIDEEEGSDRSPFDRTLELPPEQ